MNIKRALYMAAVLMGLAGSAIGQQRTTRMLHNWVYQRLGDSVSYPCRVPSVVQGDLITHGQLPDPHYRDNERLVQWPSEHDWLYTTTIHLDNSMPRGADVRYHLVFEGIDTYADIFLGGERIAQTDNMFVGYRIDVTNRLRLGDNRLVVHIKSPLREAHGRYLSTGFDYPADNDHATPRYSPYTRKAPYHYGWDWGMRLVTMGIWLPVRLECYTQARVEEVAVATSIHWSGDGQAQRAEISVVPRIDSWGQGPYRTRARLLEAHGRAVATSDTLVSSGRHLLLLDKPRLWWPRGWGDAYLYTLEVELLDAMGQILDVHRKHIGIRELHLIQEPDQWGTSCYFEVNKRPLFAKGANYIPGDQILTRRGEAYFTRLFDDIEFAEMNMIRVWGGGIYEDDRFYDEADRRGILVWQDFMFACTAYPSDAHFLSSVRQEAIYQVKRLRHRPSIALWCGNNEVEEALKYWGWQRKYAEWQYRQMADGYDPLFRGLLAEVVATYAPEHGYVHSSPIVANWGRPATWGHGDAHYWGLWYGRQPFETFEDKQMRFVSEFGFQSFPSMHSIASFAQPEDYGLETEVMRLHQKASTGNGLIREYMQRDYVIPERFEDFVYVGQVLQARGMEHVVRTLRSQRPVCMGALYWQLNDTWPAVSWSSVDYYGSYKAMHYAMRRANAPLALVAKRMAGDTLAVYVAYDGLEPLEAGHLHLSVHAFDRSKALYSRRISTRPIAPNGLQLLATLSLGDLALDTDTQSKVLDLRLSAGQREVSLRWYAHKTKDLHLPEARYRQMLIHQSKGEAVLRIKAETLLKDLLIEVPLHATRLSDNLLDLLPGEMVEIRIRHRDLDSHTPIYIRTMNAVNTSSITPP